MKIKKEVLISFLWSALIAYSVPLVLLLLSPLLGKDLDSDKLVLFASTFSVFLEIAISKRYKLAILFAVVTAIVSFSFEHLNHEILNITLWNFLTVVSVVTSLAFIWYTESKEYEESSREALRLETLANELNTKNKENASLIRLLEEKEFQKELEGDGLSYVKIQEVTERASKNLKRDIEQFNADGKLIKLQ